jgi:hypothetical protein
MRGVFMDFVGDRSRMKKGARDYGGEYGQGKRRAVSGG